MGAVGSRIPNAKAKKTAKIHTNDTVVLPPPSTFDFDLLKLPAKWRERVWLVMDDSSKKNVRQVCRELRKEIDQSIGHHITINTNIPSNTEFVQSVKVTWATVDHFDLDAQVNDSCPKSNTSSTKKLVQKQDEPKCDLDLEFDPDDLFSDSGLKLVDPSKTEVSKTFLKNPEFLEGLQIFSQVSRSLFTHLIEPSGKILRSLVFQGESLTNSSLSPNYTYNAVLDLPALKHLAIEYDLNYNEQVQMSNLRDNMTFILSAFHCPVLETFQLEPLMLANENQPQQQFLRGFSSAYETFDLWEGELLKRFVHAHRATLKNLCIFFHEINEDFGGAAGRGNLQINNNVSNNSLEDIQNGNDQPSNSGHSDLNNNDNNNNQNDLIPYNSKDMEYKCPLNLSHYSIRCTMNHPGPAPPSQMYWKRVLEEQKNLESLVIRAELWHDLASTFKMMKQLVTSNSATLKDICIGSVFRESKICSIYDFRVDFSIFCECHQLISLDLYASDEMNHLTVNDLTSDLNLSKSLIRAKNDNGPISPTDSVSMCFLGRNLHTLPKSIRFLKINGIALKSEELKRLEHHENLERITLVNCGRSGCMGVTFGVLMALLRNESIRRYVFCGFNLDSEAELLEDFIKRRNQGVFCNDIVIYKSFANALMNAKSNANENAKDKDKEKEKSKETVVEKAKTKVEKPNQIVKETAQLKNKESEENPKKAATTPSAPLKVDPKEVNLSRDQRAKSLEAKKKKKTTSCFPWLNGSSNNNARRTNNTSSSNGSNKNNTKNNNDNIKNNNSTNNASIKNNSSINNASIKNNNSTNNASIKTNNKISKANLKGSNNNSKANLKNDNNESKANLKNNNNSKANLKNNNNSKANLKNNNNSKANLKNNNESKANLKNNNNSKANLKNNNESKANLKNNNNSKANLKNKNNKNATIKNNNSTKNVSVKNNNTVKNPAQSTPGESSSPTPKKSLWSFGNFGKFGKSTKSN